MRVRARPVTPVVGVRHHRRAQPAAPLELDRVAVRVVADRQARAGAKAGVEWERDGGRPAHGRAVAAQARLAVRAHGEEAPALLDRAGAIGERLPARLPRRGPPPRSGGSRSTGGTRWSRAVRGACARTRAAGRGGTRRRRRAGTSRRPACGRAPDGTSSRAGASRRSRRSPCPAGAPGRPSMPRRARSPRCRPRCRCRTRRRHRPSSADGAEHWPMMSASSRTGSRAWNLIPTHPSPWPARAVDRPGSSRASSKPNRSATGSRYASRGTAAGRAAPRATRRAAAARPRAPCVAA